MVVLEAMDLTANEAVLGRRSIACGFIASFVSILITSSAARIEALSTCQGAQTRVCWESQVLTGESLEVSKSVELKDWVFLLAICSPSCCDTETGGKLRCPTNCYDSGQPQHKAKVMIVCTDSMRRSLRDMFRAYVEQFSPAAFSLT